MWDTVTFWLLMITGSQLLFYHHCIIQCDVLYVTFVFRHNQQQRIFDHTLTSKHMMKNNQTTMKDWFGLTNDTSSLIPQLQELLAGCWQDFGKVGSWKEGGWSILSWWYSCGGWYWDGGFVMAETCRSIKQSVVISNVHMFTWKGIIPRY